MPFHWCMDETLMVLSMIPFIGAFFLRVKTWWHVKFSHQKDTCHSHDHPCVSRKWKITGRLSRKNYGIFEAVSVDTALDALATEMVGREAVQKILNEGRRPLTTVMYNVTPYKE